MTATTWLGLVCLVGGGGGLIILLAIEIFRPAQEESAQADRAGREEPSP